MITVSYIRTVLSVSVLCLQFCSEPEGTEAAAKKIMKTELIKKILREHLGPNFALC